VGTQVALARRTVLVDDQGEIRPTPLTEKVQLRILHDPTTFGQPGVQSFLQFKLRREQLLAGKAGGLDAVGDDETRLGSLVYPRLWERLGEDSADHGFVPQLSQRPGGQVDAQFRAAFAPVR
jgi:hypothetical protein